MCVSTTLIYTVDRNNWATSPVYAICENKGADLPAHPHSLISIFVVRCLDSIIPLVSIDAISLLYIASVAEQAGLSLTLSKIPNTGFLMTRLITIPYLSNCVENKWAASSEFGTYHLCEQRRFRRACASAQSRQNLRCSLIQAVNQEEPSDRKPDPWPLWMAGYAQSKFVMTECSKTQIRLTGLK